MKLAILTAIALAASPALSAGYKPGSSCNNFDIGAKACEYNGGDVVRSQS